MSLKPKFPFIRGIARDEICITGSIVLGSSGAIASVTGFVPSAAAGVSPGVVKTAGKTGRYTVTLDRTYKSLRFKGAPGLVGDTDAAIGNTNANIAFFRNRTNKTFDIQLALASSGADTDGASGDEIHWSVIVRNT